MPEITYEQIWGLHGNDKSIFGVAYSILTREAVTKKLSVHPQTWANAVRKAVGDGSGHATAFLVTASGFTKAGIGKDRWSFEDYDDEGERPDFAYSTPNQNTDVYYITGDYASKFSKVKEELIGDPGTPVTKGWLIPNTPCTTRNESCVSAAHYIVYKMGLGWWAGGGWWMPSLANTMTWVATSLSSWNHQHYPESSIL
jgi:hypothetical protein